MAGQLSHAPSEGDALAHQIRHRKGRSITHADPPPKLSKVGYELLKVHPIAKGKALVVYAKVLSVSEKNKLLSSCLLMPLFHTLEPVVNLYW